MTKLPSYFIDEWGLLDKKTAADGGDTCHREGMFFTLNGVMSEHLSNNDLIGLDDRYITVMSDLHVDDGVFVRHIRALRDVNAWDRMSRDQLQPMIIAAGYWDKKQLKRIARGHLRRGFLFTTNTRINGATQFNHGQPKNLFDPAQGNFDYGWKMPDPTLFEIWGNFIRAFKAWYLWPLLVVFDLEGLFGAIRWRYWPKHNITMNHTLSLLQACDRLPTPISFLSRKIMPPEKLIKLLGEHFRDFDDDMQFFERMFTEAFREVLK